MDKEEKTDHDKIGQNNEREGEQASFDSFRPLPLNG